MLKRLVHIFCGLLAGWGFVAFLEANELGVTQCVEAMWNDFDEIVKLVNQQPVRPVTPAWEAKAKDTKKAGGWTRVVAHEIEPESDVVEAHLCTDRGSRQANKKKYYYMVEGELSDTPVNTPSATPVPTPAMVVNSPKFPTLSPSSPQMQRVANLTGAGSPHDSHELAQIERLKEVLKKYPSGRHSSESSSSPGSARALESHNSVDSDSHSPFPVTGMSPIPVSAINGPGDGTFFVHKLSPGDDPEGFVLLKPGLSRDGLDKGLLCSVREFTSMDGGEEITEHYNVCCTFVGVDKTPDFTGMLPLNDILTEDAALNHNDVIANFLAEIEGQYHRKMYKKGDVMGFMYKGRNVKATVVGIGTSTVVFQFGQFAGDDSDDDINVLNYYLPKMAFRRIFFTSALNSMLFYFHQLAQVGFLEEHEIKILPVKMWRSKTRSVLISQPFLDDKNLIEHYFKEIARDDCGESINVLGRWMPVDSFLREVTSQIISGVRRLDSINGRYEKEGGKGRQKIMEGFLDAKYPNYAIHREVSERGTSDHLVLRYFDLFPAHLRLFNRQPMDSNGHTQYETFDKFYQRDDGADILVREGMVGSYKKKFNKLRDASVMMKKLAASAIDLVFQNTSYHEANDILMKSMCGRKYDLVVKILGMINDSARTTNLRGRVTFDEAVDYWQSRVKKNMILRLALDFLDVAGLMNDFEKGEMSQLLSASEDEEALMQWAHELYKSSGGLCHLVKQARDKALPPDVMVPFFRGMAKQYLESPDYRLRSIKFELETAPGAVATPQQRPIGVRKTKNKVIYLKRPVRRMSGDSLPNGGSVQASRKRLPATRVGDSEDEPDFKRRLTDVADEELRKKFSRVPQVAISQQTSTPELAASPLLYLHTEIKCLPELHSGSKGAMFTHGLYPVTGIMTGAVSVNAGRGFPLICDIVAAALKGPVTASKANSMIRVPLAEALTPVMRKLEAKGIFSWARSEMEKQAMPSDLLLTDRELAPPWKVDVPDPVRNQKIHSIWSPLKLLNIMDSQLAELSTMYSCVQHQEELLLQALTITNDLKVIIDDHDDVSNNERIVYRLESYRIKEGLWAALYKPVPAKQALSGYVEKGATWMWLKRSRHYGGISWDLLGSSLNASHSGSTSTNPLPQVGASSTYNSAVEVITTRTNITHNNFWLSDAYKSIFTPVTTSGSYGQPSLGDSYNVFSPNRDGQSKLH